MINGRQVRGAIAPSGGGWVFSVTPMWMRDAGVAAGDDVIVELAPEGPQRGDLADDISAALEANPADLELADGVVRAKDALVRRVQGGRQASARRGGAASFRAPS